MFNTSCAYVARHNLLRDETSELWQSSLKLFYGVPAFYDMVYYAFGHLLWPKEDHANPNMWSYWCITNGVSEIFFIKYSNFKQSTQKYRVYDLHTQK